MPEHTGYFDEDGNELTPEEVAALGDDVEIVDEAQSTSATVPTPVAQASASPTTPPAAPHPKASKALLAVAAVAVLAVGGGAVYALHAIGSQNTATQIKENAAKKADQLKTTAEDKVETATHPAIDVCSDLSRARTDKALSVPGESMQLRILRSAPLPQQMTSTLKSSDEAKLEILQLSPASWAVYLPQRQQQADDIATTTAKQTWLKVPVSTADNSLAVGAAVTWPGGDNDAAGACAAGAPGAYRVTGDVPAGAAGLRKGQAEVSAIKGDATSTTATNTATTAAQQGDSTNRVLAVMGGSVVEAQLEYMPTETTPDK
ncbi:hypothetical protein [Gordonia sp. 852002-10350_SCH5691597]|uniref:hypothetical protein n=1 Tax=Gordonia sp. 852002-10350_SCH5691597 TaxID=1834085 RepID=UPI0007E9E563|nr:hypothetical protein [Gordonia sp. 852002-10350_SCH5691597]OBA63949.1 hypothetical protein A5777_22665 [Gordonia sp. 852002-10350_SCH5691597]